MLSEIKKSAGSIGFQLDKSIHELGLRIEKARQKLRASQAIAVGMRREANNLKNDVKRLKKKIDDNHKEMECV